MGLRKVYLIVHCQQAYAKGIFFYNGPGGGGKSESFTSRRKKKMAI